MLYILYTSYDSEIVENIWVHRTHDEIIVCVFIGSEVFPIEKDHERSLAGKLEKYNFADNVFVQSGRGVVRGVGHSVQGRRIYSKSKFNL